MKKLPALLLLLLLAPALGATELSTLVRPGWLRYSVEPRFELQRVTGSRGLSLLREGYVLPLVLQYGLVDGMEAVLDLPWVRNSAASIDHDDPLVTGSGAQRAGQGLGDLAVGVKYRLLEDDGRTPAVFVLSLLKLPSGSSSLESYARALGGETVERGTGTGSLDLVNSLIMSVYSDPVEAYVRLTSAMRGGDVRNVGGRDHQVDYGAQMEALGGLGVDVGERWSLALESLAIVTQASVWRVDGVDVLTVQGSRLQDFRAATSAQSGINLATTTQWYIGPKIGYRFAGSLAAALRVEAGLTPDSLPWRGGFELSGALRPGNLFGAFKRARTKPDAAASGSDGGDEALLEEGNAAAAAGGDQERGNLQRYLHLHLRLAEKAAAQPAWDKAADELGRLLELANLDPAFRARMDDLHERLAAVAEAQFKAGSDEAAKAAWPAAAKAWKDLPRITRGLDPERPNVKDLKARLSASSHKLYLQGMDLYVKERTKEALELWTTAALLDSPKGLERDIERVRAKLRAIKKIEKP